MNRYEQHLAWQRSQPPVQAPELQPSSSICNECSQSARSHPGNCKTLQFLDLLDLLEKRLKANNIVMIEDDQ